MNYQNILLQSDSGITTITLNRPDKRNALSLDVLTELTDAFQKTAASEARGVILAANGPVFSAGHNFGDMAGATLEETRHVF
ncbi:MAG TPA: enoyl-CoA hydratase/isomerase family protein, partial [Burkholderiaceae bacterium]|nr:enoyl-CoA hydratase/isomerase family protein [Burkholderiaceae bacterium]